ncbi:MAG: ABC transporter permease [Clostridiales bacterium]|jgi:ABC-2 type transport system permease protein|nr:ABC transporter permease [Clostridiales bacterium]
MKSYLAMFRMKFIAGLQYRAAAWAGVATQFFFGFVYIMIYLAFYKNSSTTPPMPIPQLVSYMWLQQAFLALIMLWWQDDDLMSQISNGYVAYELCRPYDLFNFWYARLLAMRLSNVLLRCVPILLITFFLPAPYCMNPPSGAGAGLWFLASLLLGSVLVVAISMFIYILTFITLSPVGSRVIITVTAEFLMGAVIPIPLMPAWLQKIMNWFPFRYTSDLPFRIYSGNIAGEEAAFQTVIQIVWILVLVAAGRLAFRSVMKRTVIQGG